MTIADRIHDLRHAHGLSQQELADKIGVSKSSINMYERGDRVPRPNVQEALADYFNVDLDYLTGRSERTTRLVSAAAVPAGFEPLPVMSSVPLVGGIACGTPITAEQNIEARIGVPAAWHADFALTCHGDSMSPRYKDGDVVCIHAQPEVENGQIAAVRIGDEATLKRFYQDGDTVTLVPINPAYPPLVYRGPELNDMQIEGLVVGFCRGERGRTNV